VRLKSGGAEIRPIKARMRAGDNFVRDAIIRHARTMANDRKIMHGSVVFGWYADGSYDLSWSVNKDSAIGNTMIPIYIHDAMLRAVIEEG